MLRSVAVLSDIHAMAVSLEHVLGEPAVRAAEAVVVTGDHLWGPLPDRTLEMLDALGERGVLIRGNADREVLDLSRDDPVTAWGAARLTTAQRALVAAMPTQVVLPVAGFGEVLFCHATPRDDQEVVLADSRPQRWAEVFAGLDPAVGTVVCGHTHLPFVRLAAGRLVINPGSVGLPYGRPGAHWALLQDGAVSLRRTLIDPEELVRRTAAKSSMPMVDEWLADFVRHPATDTQVIEAFGPRDGRES